MRLETIACPSCGREESRPWGQENGFTAVKCTHCGLVYVNPRPCLDEISSANETGQHRTDDGKVDVTFRYNPAKITRYVKIMRAIYGADLQAAGPVSWLDIGAGYGEFMRVLDQVLPNGSTISGVEPMAPKRQFAQKEGLQMVADLDEVSGQFDRISLINVFSHIPDFHGFLNAVRARLKPGGELFLQTGNGGDLARRQDYPDTLYLPDHLVFAGEAHIKKYLVEANFELIAIERQRKDRVLDLAKDVAKRVLGRNARLTLPYTSPFRSVFYRARDLSNAAPS